MNKCPVDKQAGTSFVCALKCAFRNAATSISLNDLFDRHAIKYFCISSDRQLLNLIEIAVYISLENLINWFVADKFNKN